MGRTDLDDWPGGIQQQFRAALPLVEGILKELKQQPGLEGRLDASVLDQGDAVGLGESTWMFFFFSGGLDLWHSPHFFQVGLWSGEKLGACLFPTGGVLPEMIDLAKGANGKKAKDLFLLINPQWNLKGNLVSDFGVLPWRRQRCEEFVGSLVSSYHFQQQRVQGDDIVVLRCYPAGWQASVSRAKQAGF